jgi:hypothetical protein
LDNSSIIRSTNQRYQIQLATYCLTYIRLPNMPNHHIFTLKIATAMSAETLQFSTFVAAYPRKPKLHIEFQQR